MGGDGRRSINDAPYGLGSGTVALRRRERRGTGLRPLKSPVPFLCPHPCVKKHSSGKARPRESTAQQADLPWGHLEKGPPSLNRQPASRMHGPASRVWAGFQPHSARHPCSVGSYLPLRQPKLERPRPCRRGASVGIPSLPRSCTVGC